MNFWTLTSAGATSSPNLRSKLEIISAILFSPLQFSQMNVVNLSKGLLTWSGPPILSLTHFSILPNFFG